MDLIQMFGKICSGINYCKDLLFDEACLNVISHRIPHPIKLYYQYQECHNCDFIESIRIPRESNTSHVFKTTDRILFSLNRNETNSCSKNYKFGQHGVYGLNITDFECSPIYVIKPPDNPFYPLFYFLGAVTLIILLCIFLRVISNYHLWTRIQMKLQQCFGVRIGSSVDDEDSGTPSGDSAPLVPSELIPAIRRLQQTRINSLDTFRGITIALMVFVNYGGGKYWFFKHSTWNGLTVADVIFPWFAWIMGVGIALSVRAKLRSGCKRYVILGNIFQRSMCLVALGVLFSNLHDNNLTVLRLPGVLQRLGLSYLIISSLESVLMNRQPNFQYGRWVILQDILDSWIQWITVAFIVGLHTYISFYLKVPGCPEGYLGPGGLDDHGQFFNCTGGAAGYIDRQIFGDKHLYQHPTSKHIYHSHTPFDPEGLFGVLTTSLTVFLGVAAGRIILCSNSTGGRVKRWIIYAVKTGISAGFLCNWSKNDGFIPINKNLWSLSFVFITACTAFIMFFVLYLIVDHWKIWSGKPFSQAGMNSILIYIGHGLTKDTFPFSFTPIDLTTHTEYFFQNMLGTGLWILIAYKLYKNEVFFTV
ncbi:heparan-alpha-glucosaminide N-acetyltransferase-like [Lycorma delicatula]|uniref:heparan-alpha-glucosaminide N-acetyltransferase-like n=1 Tax=Lycorma delicatula TaxID=130591 RepID=UPI003F50E3A7